MSKFQNKGISTLVGILIILLVAIILGGGIYLWQQKNLSIFNSASNQNQDQTAGWQTYIFSVAQLREDVTQASSEIQKEVEQKIEEQKLEGCSFEMKYPQNWTAIEWPLHGAIVPNRVFIGEGAANSPTEFEGCVIQMLFIGNLEKEKYCFPVSMSGGDKCNAIFNQMLSTFKFLK